MKRKLSLPRIAYRVFRVSPSRFILQYVLTALSAVAAAQIAAAIESIFSRAQEFAHSGDSVFPLLSAIAILLLLYGLSEAAEGESIYISQSYDTLTRESLIHEMNAHVGRLPCLCFESPDTLNKINGAFVGIGSLRSIVHCMMSIVTYYLPYFVVYGIYLYSLRPVLVLAIPMVFLPAVVSEVLKGKLYAELEEQSAPLRCKQECYLSYVAEKEFAKETRLLGAVDFFTEKYKKNRQQLNAVQMRSHRRRFALESAGKLLHFIGYFGVILLLIDSVFRGLITAGAFTAVFATIGTVMERCDILVSEQLASLSRGYGSLRPYFALVDLEEEKETGSELRTAPEFRLEKASFSYPGGGEVLQEIDLTIRAGETLALVGENGCGKTTLTKLLLGLYPLTSGKLYRDGVSCGQETSLSIQREYSGIFQMFGKYPMTISENIRLSDTYATEDQLESVLAQAGLDIHTSKFPHGMETLLSREFGGTDLSGGQWQRIAIARGLLKNGKFLVMDEPTAAIDPMQEHFLYQTFLDAAKGKTAVIVTHRLGLARFCDRIAFMQAGRILALGTHEELLQSCPDYALQWNAQADSYREETVGQPVGP